MRDVECRAKSVRQVL